MSPELSARRTAAAAVLADFKRETGKYLDDPAKATPRPDYSMWAWRLASELGSVLQRLDDEAEIRHVETDFAEAGAQLAGIRTVCSDFDWETGDRQYALEAIDAIVNRGRS